MAYKMRRTDIDESVWNRMKMDYVSEGLSYRDLEKKYGLSYGSLRKRGQDEEWGKQREHFCSMRSEKSLEALADSQAQECVKALFVANKLIDKIEKSVEAIEDTDTQAIKHLTGALKDLKEIGVFRSDMDRLEQQARIAKLKKDAETENKDVTVSIVFEDDEMEEYAG